MLFYDSFSVYPFNRYVQFREKLSVSGRLTEQSKMQNWNYWYIVHTCNTCYFNAGDNEIYSIKSDWCSTLYVQSIRKVVYTYWNYFSIVWSWQKERRMTKLRTHVILT